MPDSVGSKFRRFAHNKPGRYNQGRRRLLPGSFYHSNQEMHCTSPYSLTILPHGREWRDGILAVIDAIKAGKGNIVWNVQAMFIECSKHANCHHIAGSNNGSKVLTLVEQLTGCLISILHIPPRVAQKVSIQCDPSLFKSLVTSQQALHTRQGSY